MESIGGTIGGKYRLTRELGRGGMGVVFEATNVVTEARVAIKFLTAEAAKSEFRSPSSARPPCSCRRVPASTRRTVAGSCIAT